MGRTLHGGLSASGEGEEADDTGEASEGEAEQGDCCQ